MRQLYSVLTSISILFLKGSALFSRKMKLFVSGRRQSFGILASKLTEADKTIWFHCASLGEYEQGLPIMERIKNSLPGYKLVITFFSPSGYEHKKHSPVADVVCYLPYDTIANSRKFLDLVHPSLAVFVKYEFWPNYLLEMEQRGVHTLLISGLFRQGQSFFKPHGFFMRKAIRTIDHLFVQNTRSEEMLRSIGVENVTVSGDTRFDRVAKQIEQDNGLEFMDRFVRDKPCIVCGSTWPEDDEILMPYINNSDGVKFVIAPHIISDAHISGLQEKIQKKLVCHSDARTDLENADVLLIDAIGYLTRIYSYADIAYVGGAMGNSGLHNILEPATFGLPIVIGKNYSKFPEAIRLESLAGLFSVASAEELSDIMQRLISNKNLREKTGMICGHFVNSNMGATKIVMDHINKLHANGLI